MKLNPVWDQIQVERIEARTSDTIQMLTQEVTQEGIVISVGPGFVCEANGELVETTVKVGDRILFPHNSGNDVTIDGSTYLIIRERDIIGTLT